MMYAKVFLKTAILVSLNLFIALVITMAIFELNPHDCTEALTHLLFGGWLK